MGLRSTSVSPTQHRKSLVTSRRSPKTSSAGAPERNASTRELPEQSLNPGDQLPHRKRLGQEVVDSRAEPLEPDLLVRAGGQHEDDQVAAPLANFTGDLHPVDSGQHEVDDHHRHVRGKGLCQTDSPVGGGIYVESLHGEGCRRTSRTWWDRPRPPAAWPRFVSDVQEKFRLRPP